MKRIIALITALLFATPAFACDHFTRAYATAATVDFCLWETDGTDFKTDAALVAGDIKVMKDEGAEANCSTGTGACVTDEGSCYSVALTSTEMTAARVTVIMIDSATKAYLDKCLVIDTFGDASAQFPTADVNVTSINSTTAAAGVELAACPGDTADVISMIKYLYQTSRNKFTATATTGKLKKGDASTDLCTFTTSDDGTTFSNSEGS